MSKAREQVVSNCEKKFLEKCLNDYNRLDGRAFDEFREFKIEFGKDYGCCYVSLGETQVLAQVSCEIQTPKTTRPSEGILFINLELNPLGAPNFEVGRQSDVGVQLNRLLEKSIKDSRAVDLESLCIKVNEKVWVLRLDINVLNHEGNILDCASVAAIAALAHFRRPDVTCDGEEIVVHTYAQRDSIPTVLHHYPVCISFAIFNNGEITLADPSLLEEGVADAQLTVGLNAYKELCSYYLGGSALMSPNLIHRITNKAAARAISVIQKIKEAVEEDSNKRLNNENIGFQHSHKFTDNFVMGKESLSQCLNRWASKSKKKRQTKRNKEQMEIEETVEPAKVESIGKQSAVLLPPESATSKAWAAVSEDDMDDDEVEVVPIPEKPIETLDISDSGSEEEKVVVLNADRQTNKKSRKNKK